MSRARNGGPVDDVSLTAPAARPEHGGEELAAASGTSPTGERGSWRAGSWWLWSAWVASC